MHALGHRKWMNATEIYIQLNNALRTCEMRSAFRISTAKTSWNRPELWSSLATVAGLMQSQRMIISWNTCDCFPMGITALNEFRVKITEEMLAILLYVIELRKGEEIILWSEWKALSIFGVRFSRSFELSKIPTLIVSHFVPLESTLEKFIRKSNSCC